MKINEKYLETLKNIEGWVTVSEWAMKFGEMFPELLEKANRETANHKRPATGLQGIAARISSWISTGDFNGFIEIDDSTRPRKVRYLSEERRNELIEVEIAEDIAPINRAEKIKSDEAKLSTNDWYRLEEIESICSTLNSYFKLDFEVDHALALLNKEKPGAHHPSNLQILLKNHNRVKNSMNWERFSIDEQIEYILSVIKIQKLISNKMKIDLEENVVNQLIQRLKLVY